MAPAWVFRVPGIWPFLDPWHCEISFPKHCHEFKIHHVSEKSNRDSSEEEKELYPFCIYIYIYIIYLFIFSIYLSIYFFSHLFIYIDRIFWDDFLHKNTSSRFIWRAEFPTRFSQWCFFVPLLIGPRLEPQIGGAKRFLKIGSTEGIYIYIQTKGDKTKIRL